jgi:hypothetical protein
VSDVKTYRKRPLIVEALSSDLGPDVIKLNWPDIIITDHSVFDKFSGWVDYKKNDMIVRGVQGEYYPCNPEVFMTTFEEFDDEVIPTPTEGSRPTQ